MSNFSRRLRLLIDFSSYEWGRQKIVVLGALIATVGVTACDAGKGSDTPPRQVVGIPQSAPVGLVAGSPEAEAVLDALNDPNLTWIMLVDEVGVSEIAATGWTTFRLEQPFESLDHVMAIDGVTSDDVTQLAVWAWANGYLPIETELLGTWDDVDFTETAATVTLRLVNEADERMLDEEIGLDTRAVTSILAARPVISMTELSGLFWIGPDTMAQLKHFALEYYSVTETTAAIE